VGAPVVRRLETLADQPPRAPRLAEQPSPRLIADLARYPRPQGSVVDPVEELRQVAVHRSPLPRVERALERRDGVVGRASGPKAQARRGDLRVKERPPPLGKGWRDQPVHGRGHSSPPLALAVALGTLRAPHGRGLGPRGSSRWANAWPVCPRQGGAVLAGQPIDPGGTLRGFPRAPGFAQVLRREDPLHELLTQGGGDDLPPRRRHLAQVCLRRVGPVSSVAALFGPSLSDLGEGRELL
jgi:hypothetical protein